MQRKKNYCKYTYASPCIFLIQNLNSTMRVFLTDMSPPDGSPSLKGAGMSIVYNKKKQETSMFFKRFLLVSGKPLSKISCLNSSLLVTRNLKGAINKIPLKDKQELLSKQGQ